MSDSRVDSLLRPSGTSRPGTTLRRIELRRHACRGARPASPATLGSTTDRLSIVKYLFTDRFAIRVDVVDEFTFAGGTVADFHYAALTVGLEFRYGRPADQHALASKLAGNVAPRLLLCRQIGHRLVPRHFAGIGLHHGDVVHQQRGYRRRNRCRSRRQSNYALSAAGIGSFADHLLPSHRRCAGGRQPSGLRPSASPCPKPKRRDRSVGTIFSSPRRSTAIPGMTDGPFQHGLIGQLARQTDLVKEPRRRLPAFRSRPAQSASKPWCPARSTSGAVSRHRRRPARRPTGPTALPPDRSE